MTYRKTNSIILERDFNMQLLFPLLILEKVSISEQEYHMPCKTAETLTALPDSDCASLDSSKFE